MYSLPEQRRPGSPGGFALFGLLGSPWRCSLGGLLIGRWTGTALRRQSPAAQHGAAMP
jgi:hypothetical protein